MALRICSALPMSSSVSFFNDTQGGWRRFSSLVWLIWNKLNARDLLKPTAVPCDSSGIASGRNGDACQQPYCTGSSDSSSITTGSDPGVLDGALQSSQTNNRAGDTGAHGSYVSSPNAHTRTPAARTSKVLGRRRGEASVVSQELNNSSNPGLLSVLGAMAGLVRSVGAGSTGLGVGHVTFGLQALARRHEEQRLCDHPAGRQLAPASSTQAVAEQLLDAMELAHGAYRRSAASLAATTCLRAQHIRVWRPEGGRLQPGYYVAVDHFGRRVVWGVRGTRVFSDLLTDLAMAAHPLGGGSAHWGMTHAAHWMIQEEASRVTALLRSLGPPGSYRLQLVGHSLGGGVAALAAIMLREGLVEAARTAAIPPELISCVAFAPPAILSASLAELCRPYVTSVVLNNDIVPRFNATSLARLQEELRDVDWYAELQRTIMDHTLVKSLSTKLEALAPATIGPTVEQASRKQEHLQVLQAVDGAAAGTLTPAVATATTAATGMVQQLSAAVLESAAFRAAVQSLDEWKAKAVAAAGDQAEAAMRRQLELIQAWLQDLTTVQCDSANAAGSDSGPVSKAKSSLELPKSSQHGTATPSADTAAEIRRTAEVAAERLRQSIESAVASLTLAATASKERFSASLPPLPPLPSLPQPHELPMVETTAVTTIASSTMPVCSTTTEREEISGGDVAAAEVAGEDDVTAAAKDGAGLAGQRATQIVHHQVSKELPLLLPPGRILYIRPRAGEWKQPLSLSSSQQQLTVALAPAKVMPACGGGADGAAAAVSIAPLRVGYVVLELPVGEGFRRLVLGRSALEEHQCKTYRRVLTQLAFKE
ncbi:hypothetical protein Vretimale_5550 [Volvox reticuliferus]|uniref:Fungal lipase-type domain-containing protein n=1 Tax=Volvox reticuliferus TaxID=1737510 RepID=A0A8J4LKM6_9CHLO|nr:hypothetical protein Vretifemale_5555 [Volvox reticuliferus]GIM00554.1 hypothetical protein Vretimale_5550 [Volvox reticuliferus]